jgi:hypothetical protein
MGKSCMPLFVAQHDLAYRLQFTRFPVRLVYIDHAVIEKITCPKTNGARFVEVNPMGLLRVARYDDWIKTQELIRFVVDDTYPVRCKFRKVEKIGVRQQGWAVNLRSPAYEPIGNGLYGIDRRDKW